MRGFAQYLYTLINFSDLRKLVNFPCATIGVGDCEANQSSWHEAFVLQECPLGGATLDALLCSLYWLFVLSICGAALSPPGNEHRAPA